ncbi:putative protein kinase RLK-Pelle-RLCK-Os family [Rosa chinensis]|uniref:Protein kinase domain-containing protein n=1 Tax=Rosa chinensis TaxID=74649 RepID=A0A2P6QT33_ROSCH|nr:putative protein kinase RLK-Pelle-RLCK-Os family [Rosa chinensis]
MSNGSLDKFLFHGNKILGFKKSHEIAVGTTKRIAYLHEECQQQIVHYDIKPEKIVLDENFFPKVADFGLAKLFNRDKTHISMTGFGMLLFEIIGRRRNLDDNLPESQDWFPRWGWKKFEAAELGELVLVCGIDEKDKEAAERMLKVAICCVQYRPELRPLMSVVVKMLEGEIEIPRPSINPIQYSFPGTLVMVSYSTSIFDTDTSQTATRVMNSSQTTTSVEGH